MKKSAVILTGLALLAFAAWKVHEARHPKILEKFSRLPAFEAVSVTPNSTQKMTRENMAGKVWVADFIFTSCGGPCPVLSQRMSELKDYLPENVHLVTFTVDPERDTPDVLRRYGEKYGADFTRWTFARTDKTQLYRLVFEGFRMEVARNPGGDDSARFLHSTRFALVDKSGYVRGFYDTDRSSYRKFLKEDALRVLQEAQS